MYTDKQNIIFNKFSVLSFGLLMQIKMKRKAIQPRLARDQIWQANLFFESIHIFRFCGF